MDAHTEKEQMRRIDPRSTRELIEIALTETDENAAWETIHVMQSRVSREDFDAACALRHSEDARERQLGADILGQFEFPTRA